MKRFARVLLATLAVTAVVQSAQAGSVALPGTGDVKNVIGTNDRGDILWSRRSNGGFGLTLSTRNASGVYTHALVDATVAGKGWDYSNLAENGDAAWLGRDAAGVENVYHYDATTGLVRQLTPYTDVFPRFAGVAPQLGANGSMVWFVAENGVWQLHFFDKPAGQSIQLAARPSLDIGRPIAINKRNSDPHWLERGADGIWELRKFDSRTRTISVLARRPAGTNAPLNNFSLAVNEGGDVAWVERVAGTTQEDVFLFDQRANAVRRITNTAGNRKYAVRINAVGDIAWKTDAQVWLYSQRSESAAMIGPKSDYQDALALNDMGEVAWNLQTGDSTSEMHLYKRATGSNTRVRPGLTGIYEATPALSGSGELFFRSSWSFGTQGEIVRSTRDFTCN